MRIYIDKCGYNFNKAAATIENALTFTEGKYFDSCAALKKITKASLALYEMANAIYAAAESQRQKGAENEIHRNFQTKKKA